MLKQINKIDGQIIERTIYVLLWSLFLLFPILIIGGNGNLRWERVVLEWVRLLPFLLFFIIHNSLLIPAFLMKKKYLLYGCGLIISIIAVIMLFPVCREIQFLVLPERPPYPIPGIGQQRMAAVYGVRNLSDKILFMILIMAFNLLLKYFFIQQQKLRLEETKSREAIQTELNFLKNQISPHFFMNTLNNIHALIDYDPDIAKETVISLSRMMRHILYESQSRRVHIKKEMDFIRSYVELMRLKTSEKVAISCNIPDNLPDKSIPPLIFTSLIENAFKHGVSLKEKSYICIDFSFPDEGHMKCRIANSNHSANRQGEHKGIGLENTRRRLDIEFPSAYILEISDTPNEYTVNINIPI